MSLVMGVLIGVFLIPTIKEIKIRMKYTGWFKDYNLFEIIYEFIKDIFHTTFFSIW